MGAPVHVPPTRPSTPTIALPPTRPSTPIFGRIDRIAEAPSRADPHLPLVETSSPVQAPPTTMGVDFASEQGRINSNNQDEEPAQGDNQNEQNGHQAIAVSSQIVFTDICLFPSFSDIVVSASEPLYVFVAITPLPPFPPPQICLWCTFASCTTIWHKVPIFCSAFIHHGQWVSSGVTYFSFPHLLPLFLLSARKSIS